MSEPAPVRETEPDAAPGARRLVPDTEPEPLPSPAELRSRQPRSSRAERVTAEARDAIRDVLRGRDRRRLVAIVGPCSIHDADQALRYGARLARLAHELSDELVVVMRTYFEKPRTRLGWKGFLDDSALDGRGDRAAGLAGARRLLLDLAELGLPCGAELLDPALAPFLADGLAWGCIGARTVESQVHRELASGLPLPIGFKNTTAGDVAIACDAVLVARESHWTTSVRDDGRLASRRSPGNPDGHVVLRGGGGVANHDAECVAWAASRARRDSRERPVLVDCSHGNSHRNHRLQAPACRAVLDQFRRHHDAIAGFALESFLRPGRQDWRPGETPADGVSITDACIGWDETEALLREAAGAVREAARPRRNAQAGGC